MSIEKLFTRNRPPLAPKVLRFEKFSDLQSAPRWLMYCVVDVSANISVQALIEAPDVVEFFERHNRTFWIGGTPNTFKKIQRLTSAPDRRRVWRGLRLIEGRGTQAKRLTCSYQIYSINQDTGAVL